MVFDLLTPEKKVDERTARKLGRPGSEKTGCIIHGTPIAVNGDHFHQFTLELGVHFLGLLLLLFHLPSHALFFSFM